MKCIAGRLSLLAFLLLFSWPTARAAGPEVWNAEELLNAYARAINLVDQRYAGEVLLLLDTRNVAQSHLALLGEVQLVAAELGNSVPNSEELAARVDRFLVPEVWRSLKENELRPTIEEVLRFRNQHPGQYSTPAWIRGARILIEDSPTSATATAEVEKQLRANDKSFRDIARAYYSSQGESHDGDFGRVAESDINEEIFGIFQAQEPGELFFGPVQTQRGILFGQLEDKGPEGFRPLEQVRPSIERRIARDRFDEWSATFLGEQEAKYGLIRHWQSAGEKAPTPDTVVYTINGQSITYQDVLNGLVEVLGDRESFAFFESVTNTAIRDHLIILSEEAERVRRSPEFQFLNTAIRAHERYHHLLDKKAPTQPADEETLQQFYEENKDEFYMLPAEVKFVVIEIPMIPNKALAPAEQRKHRLRAWNAAAELREEIVSLRNPLEFDMTTIPAEMKPRRFIVDQWTTISAIPPAFAEPVSQMEEGATSEVLIGRQLYSIVKLIGKRAGGHESFEAVHDRLHLDSYWARRLRARSDLLAEAQLRARAKSK